MLVLTRKPEQEVVITTKAGEVITIKLLGVDGQRVHMGVTAPDSVGIWRDEIYQRIVGSAKNHN